jgi:hypothetical protein
MRHIYSEQHQERYIEQHLPVWLDGTSDNCKSFAAPATSTVGVMSPAIVEDDDGLVPMGNNASEEALGPAENDIYCPRVSDVAPSDITDQEENQFTCPLADSPLPNDKAVDSLIDLCSFPTRLYNKEIPEDKGKIHLHIALSREEWERMLESWAHSTLMQKDTEKGGIRVVTRTQTDGRRYKERYLRP